MLEKIRLPAKPALRGNEWVLDASHCQTCSSAFSVFNWKHYCHRCGGIFCGNCTQQKMNLRGQGEGPVRVCDSCKKTEDAARFEARQGRRGRAPKGGSKSTSQMQADAMLEELIPSELSPQSSRRTSLVNENHELANTLQNNACRSMRDEKAYSMGRVPGTQGEVNEEGQIDVLSPEILRQQAQQDKRQWIALKREGKNEEALLAFKRGRELERQAENLELSLRRNQRKLMSSAIARREKHEDHSGLERKKKSRALTSVEGNHEGLDRGLEPIKSKRVLKEPEEKDDLKSALKDLGWTDEDPEVDMKQSKSRTVENELAEIAATVNQVEDSSSKVTISSAQVLAHKRRALALKREGKLAEAKEELKKGKIIERQLEEQETGNAEESDDDLAALIRDMERQNTTQRGSSSKMDMAGFSGTVDFEHEDEEGIEVTDSDMNDPEMAAALSSIGWEEDTAAIDKLHAYSVSGAPLASKQKMQTSLTSGGGIKLKDPAVELKADASLNGMEEAVHVTDEDMEDPYFQSALQAMGFAEEPAKVTKAVTFATSKSFEKRNLQQQILTMKKEALGLKRASKIQEAKEKLLQAKNLEKELQFLQTQHLEEDGVSAAYSGLETINKNAEVGSSAYEAQVTVDETGFDNVDVTEEDMGDAEFAKALQSFGWQDDWATEGNIHTEKEYKAVIPKPSENDSRVATVTHPPKKRSELQKELLGLKRAALKLRREGRLEEAEDELKKAHVLEQLIEELETGFNPPKKESYIQHVKDDEVAQYQVDGVAVKETSMENPAKLAASRSFGCNELEQNVETIPKTTFDTMSTSSAPENNVETMPKTAFDNICASPVHTSTLTEGTSSEINSDQKADNMTSTHESNNEFNSENKNTEVITSSNDTRIDSFDSHHRRKSSAPTHIQPPPAESAKPDAMHSKAIVESFVGEADVVPSINLRDAAESTAANIVTETPLLQEALQRDILAYKKKALALKREGKQAEAKEQLREAKMLEKQLALQRLQPDVESEVFDTLNSGTTSTVASATPMEGSSQQGDSSSNTGTGSHDSRMTSFGAHQTPAQKYTAGKDRLKLQRESLAHKRKALALRREGRMDEAEAEFDLAKSIEKQMEELGGSVGETVSMPMGLDVSPVFGHQEKADTGLVDDLFDPQLLAALKGLGWKESDLQGQNLNTRDAIREKPPRHSSEKTDLAPVRQNEERQQLEERIKSEKIRALQLKRSGQQSEALNVLRGAKQLERQLQSMPQ